MRRHRCFLLLLLLLACRRGEAPSTVATETDQTATTTIQLKSPAEQLARFAESQQRVTIVDGTRTPPGQYNECVAVGDDLNWFCSGSLIGRNVILTAAHCHDKRITRVFFGPDVKNPAGGRIVEIANSYVPDGYVPGQPFHDIAVAVLRNDVAVTPVPIAASFQLPADRRVIIAGYGATDTQGTAEFRYRRWGEIAISLCASLASGCNPATELVGDKYREEGACGGDSGGPVYNRARTEIIGSTARKASSASAPCGDGAVYTRADAYHSWIKATPGAHW